MARSYYFHQILSKVNTAFLSIFTGLKIAKLDGNGIALNYRDVPVVFGNKKKFLTKIQKNKNFNKYLPMISVIITGLVKNPTGNRAGSLVELMKYFSGSQDSIKKLFSGVPYNINYSVAIITQSLTEAEMLIEQIAPQFNPYENITIKEFSFLPEFTRDIKISLIDVTTEFLDEVDEGDIRRVEVEFTFEVPAYFYRPIPTSGIIKHIKLDIVDSTLVPTITGNLMSSYTYSVSGDSDDYVVTEDDESMEVGDVIGYCWGQIAKYKVPEEVVFVDDLPVTSASQKIQHYKLRQQALAESKSKSSEVAQ